ncbi:MAG: beta galactosidase jelly roll domain-containing protein [Verrucomicrobiales bacterium]|nr:beta galactosidase jelly roll domain-containing protein [Verrucomicrobiales bacterium]
MLKRPVTSLPWVGLTSVILLVGQSPAADWKPANGPLKTRWTDQVSPERALPEYPRPTLVRERWQNLNGLWQYAVTSRDAGQPTTFEGEILVPYPIESALSGVARRVNENDRLWYRREFRIPRDWRGQRILLHFGAVDFQAEVWVNGTRLGEHAGGYDGFSFDITEALRRGANELVVAVWDPTDAGHQPRGKQVHRPGGIMYTPTSGIWQTVWLEPVPEAHFREIRITPDFDHSAVLVQANAVVPGAAPTVRVQVFEGGKVLTEGEVSMMITTRSIPPQAAPRIQLGVPDARAWTPDSPHLYDLVITLEQEGKVVDRIQSYFGLRKVSLGKDANGFTRILLNNEPLFQYGPLDQGFWPDGLYTAPTDAAMQYDIEMTKRLGMNMARKHVKVEPERWYYWCDKLGLLVWQDMPSGSFGGRDDARLSDEASAEYEKELRRLVAGRYNHPSIIMWVPFNEGWGQHETPRYAALVKQLDPSRLVNEASGWTDRGSGDVKDIHAYPGPSAPAPEEERAVVLGEFGGLGLPMRGHTWQSEANWGYRSFTDSDSLTAAYVTLMKKLHPLVGSHGLSAAVYTQTSDVEVEVNGLMTYDRERVKLDLDAIAAAARKLYGPPPPPPIIKTLLPTSEKPGVQWRYTTTQPGNEWFQSGFNDSAWPQGEGGFGTRSTPGAIVRTEWQTGDIWLRREFELPEGFSKESLHFLIHHDEDATIYVNGEPVAEYQGYTTSYEPLPATKRLAEVLRPGRNVVAVHCHQTGGGQYIDLGIASVIEQ